MQTWSWEQVKWFSENASNNLKSIAALPVASKDEQEGEAVILLIARHFKVLGRAHMSH